MVLVTLNAGTKKDLDSVTRKPDFVACNQQKRRPACASAFDIIYQISKVAYLGS